MPNIMIDDSIANVKRHLPCFGLASLKNKVVLATIRKGCASASKLINKSYEHNETLTVHDLKKGDCQLSDEHDVLCREVAVSVISAAALVARRRAGATALLAADAIVHIVDHSSDVKMKGPLQQIVATAVTAVVQMLAANLGIAAKLGDIEREAWEETLPLRFEMVKEAERYGDGIYLVCDPEPDSETGRLDRRTGPALRSAWRTLRKSNFGTAMSDKLG